MDARRRHYSSLQGCIGACRCREVIEGERPRTRVVVLLAIAVIGAHAGLLLWSSAKNAPVWDEWGHLPAGLSHWYFGDFDLYRVNPPLVRMVATLPVMFSGIKLDNWPGVADNPELRLEWECAVRLVSQQGQRVLWYFTVSRWACVPFGIVGAWICFRWASRLYGSEAGLLAATLWCFSPGILGNAQLITPDAGAAALGTAACYLFWGWLRTPTATRAIGVGVMLGLAELTKFTWLILFALWPVLWVAWRVVEVRLRSARGLIGELRQLILIFGLAVFVINLGYGFEGTCTRLGSIRFVSRMLRRIPSEDTTLPSKVGNRFSNSWANGLAVPLPANYLQGIDRQKFDFEADAWSYLRGEWRRHGWWYYYIFAIAIKEPVGTWILAVLAGGLVVLGRGYSTSLRDELTLVAPAISVLALVSSQTGFNHHVRYALPALPFLFIWISRIALAFRLGHSKVVFAIFATSAWSVGSSLYYYPHGLSYFNELVGGPMGGHHHLDNSNIDWGQDLLYLKRWCDEHPDAMPLGVAYYVPLVDPADFGIPHTSPPVGLDSGFATTLHAGKVGPQPGWYALSVNKLHTRTKEYAYFLSFEPVATAGYSIYIYHITLEQANRMRLDMGWPLIECAASQEDVRRDKT